MTRSWITTYKIIFLSTLTWIGVTLLPQIEGYLLPVVSNAKVTHIQETSPEGWSTIYGDISKLRDCTFVDLEFEYISPTGLRVFVQHEFAEPSSIRPPGEFGFGPWRVQYTPEQLRNGGADATAVHECHVLWLTRTHMPVEIDE